MQRQQRANRQKQIRRSGQTEFDDPTDEHELIPLLATKSQPIGHHGTSALPDDRFSTVMLPHDAGSCVNYIFDGFTHRQLG